MPLIIRVSRQNWARVCDIFDCCDFLIKRDLSTPQEKDSLGQTIWDLNEKQLQDLHWQFLTLCQQFVDYKRGEIDAVYMPYLLKKPQDSEKP